MRTYWEGTVKHQITDENGKLKKVNSVYLVEAVNHTEVEAILTQKGEKMFKPGFEIKPIRQSDISRVVVGEPTGKYFKVKVEFDFEKKETESILVEAADLESALSGFVANEEVLGYDFEVISVARSKVLDVYDQSVPDFGALGVDGLHGVKVTVVDSDDVDFQDDPVDDFLGTLDAKETYSVTNTDDDMEVEAP